MTGHWGRIWQLSQGQCRCKYHIKMSTSTKFNWICGNLLLSFTHSQSHAKLLLQMTIIVTRYIVSYTGDTWGYRACSMEHQNMTGPPHKVCGSVVAHEQLHVWEYSINWVPHNCGIRHVTVPLATRILIANVRHIGVSNICVINLVYFKMQVWCLWNRYKDTVMLNCSQYGASRLK